MNQTSIAKKDIAQPLGTLISWVAIVIPIICLISFVVSPSSLQSFAEWLFYIIPGGATFGILSTLSLAFVVTLILGIIAIMINIKHHVNTILNWIIVAEIILFPILLIPLGTAFAGALRD